MHATLAFGTASFMFTGHCSPDTCPRLVPMALPRSPYKFWGRGGGGKPADVHVVPAPDPYRYERVCRTTAVRQA